MNVLLFKVLCVVMSAISVLPAVYSLTIVVPVATAVLVLMLIFLFPTVCENCVIDASTDARACEV